MMKRTKTTKCMESREEGESSMEYPGDASRQSSSSLARDDSSSPRYGRGPGRGGAASSSSLSSPVTTNLNGVNVGDVESDRSSAMPSPRVLVSDPERSLECLQHDWALPAPSKRTNGMVRKLLRRRRRPRKQECNSSNTVAPSSPGAKDDQEQPGAEFYSPLLQSLVRYESVRNKALDDNSSLALRYPKSNEGWFATLWILRGRALDRIIVPYLLTVGHATLYTCLQQLVFPQLIHSGPVAWSDVLLGVVLNSTLIFLLVFRLNRAADRFWTARALWGTIVAEGRMLVSGLAVHGTPITDDQHGGVVVATSDLLWVQRRQEQHRDHAIRWVLAFFLAAMESLRGRKVLDGDMFAGILLPHEVLALQDSVHRPLFTIHHIRHHLRHLCRYQSQPSRTLGASEPGTLSEVDEDGAVTRVTAASRTLSSLETKLDAMMNACGGAERIRATPLPIVYVTHLRTVLLLTLLLLPYVYGPAWQWSTIAVIAVSSFVWLGIEGTAREVENPFGYRVNDLPMDGYCKGMMSTTIQELRLVAQNSNLTSP